MKKPALCVLAALFVSSALLSVRAGAPPSPGPLEVQSYRPTDTGFSRVLDILPTDSAVWVLSDDEPFLSRVPLDGGAIWTVGRRGRGPAELEHPLSLISVDGGVSVVDPVSGRALHVGPDLTVGSAPWASRLRTMVRTVLATHGPQSPFRMATDGGSLVGIRYRTPVRFPVEQGTGRSDLATFGWSRVPTPRSATGAWLSTLGAIPRCGPHVGRLRRSGPDYRWPVQHKMDFARRRRCDASPQVGKASGA